ncbi:MAG: PP2C family protein-serine/threonine phosphatase [Mycobacteriales bacterium]
MTLQLRFAARSDVGLLRSGNEDAAYAGPRLLAVADGMGGHAAGEVASAEAIAALVPLDEEPPGADVITSLRDSVEEANQRLRAMVAAQPELEGMGTTLTALLWAGRRLGLVHIGDSRCYLLRDGALTQITHDHTLVQSLVDEGRISPEEANYHPQRSLITRALDGRGEVELDLSVRESRLGDRYLLCTDGLSGVVSEETMLEALREADPGRACERLVDLALRGGGPDNVTCIVADVVDEDAIAEPAAPSVLGAASLSDSGAAVNVLTPAADTPAGRAARATRSPSATALPATHAAPPRRRRGLALLGLVAVVVLLALAAGAYFLDRAQWYVGATSEKPRLVALFQGFDASVIGLHLSDVDTTSRVPLNSLDAFDRQQVAKGIEVSGRRAGRRKLSQLLLDACANLSSLLPPSPLPSPTPSRSPSPSKSASPHPSNSASPQATVPQSPTAIPAAISTMKAIGCPSPEATP